MLPASGVGLFPGKVTTPRTLMAFKGRPEEEEGAPEMESDERMPAKNGALERARASVCVVGVVKG